MNKKTFFIVTLFIVSVFLFRKIAYGQSNDIVITEIGAYEKSGFEWIEIYNKGLEPVDLSGWKFWEAGVNHGLKLVAGEDAILDS